MPTPDGVVVLSFPFRGTWRVENSPARRVPSHGTEAFGVSHAIDFVAVDERNLSAPRTWRTRVGVEDPEGFLGFGEPVLAPAAGVVVAVHDAEPDHEARRSPLRLAAYAMGQAGRARRGIVGLAGNHVVIALAPAGPFVLLAHLRQGSASVRIGQQVAVGEQVGECGNTGNSTEPHVHLQVSDSIEGASARGVPVAFRAPDGRAWLPGEGELVTA
ncbi:M23 family metallopeptidase [Knoellia aerolata]|uniref:Peptidase M23 n=1 Tax=Knoellia aerolata DSM 18566 TaxID=1385519 RepID=A0A0A0K5I7_9MICO|nr:M23 family metallopeptidase [Knoellia aerolata]KGN43091.1 peptidase M23 [Knoellia aerolata DSM 18566]